MNIGNQILNIREEKKLTQEEFGMLFNVTRKLSPIGKTGKVIPICKSLLI